MNKRLMLCMEFIKGDHLCDIGTDHAYLPCEAVRNGICKKAVAADIVEGPLVSAMGNIRRYGLSDRIGTVLSDGFDNINGESFTDVVIAGMGGELIADIIGRALAENKIDKTTNLILQPMTKAEVLRRYLADNGYRIIKEKAVLDSGRIYSVINCVYSGESTEEYDEVSIEAGFMDLSGEYEKMYARHCIDKLNKKINGMKSSGADTTELERLCAGISERMGKDDEQCRS